MAEWLVKKGNTAVQDVLVKDKEGNAVQDLADAQEIKFQVKEKNADTVPKIAKTKDDGIEVNKPETGYLRITLKPSDTELPVANYYMGLEIKWNDERIYEVDLTVEGVATDAFRIDQDIV
jgi:hypothetical protein